MNKKLIQGQPEITRQNGLAIRLFRQLQGMSPQALADSAGITTPHLRNVELEYRSASRELVFQIAKALAVPPAALIRIPTSLERETV